MFFDTPAALITAMFFSGFWATVFSTVLIIALILEIAADEFALGYGSVLGYAVLMAIFTDVNPFMWIWHNPGDAIGFLAGYVVFGAVYSAVKYRSFVRTMAEKIKDVKVAFIKDKKLEINVLAEIPSEFMSDWKRYLSDKLPYGDWKRVQKGLYPSAQRDIIINWIAFWPVSALGLFIADPLKEMVNWAYERMISVYRITYDRIINKFINTNDINFN